MDERHQIIHPVNEGKKSGRAECPSAHGDLMTHGQKNQGIKRDPHGHGRESRKVLDLEETGHRFLPFPQEAEKVRPKNQKGVKKKEEEDLGGADRLFVSKLSDPGKGRPEGGESQEAHGPRFGPLGGFEGDLGPEP